MEIITVKNICKDYKKLRALNNVSLSINEGELYGLLGVNGAGKTTLLKILSGLTNLSSGEFVISGYTPKQMDEIKRIIDISPQETAVAKNLTVMENLRFFQGLYNQNDEEFHHSGSVHYSVHSTTVQCPAHGSGSTDPPSRPRHRSAQTAPGSARPRQLSTALLS